MSRCMKHQSHIYQRWKLVDLEAWIIFVATLYVQGQLLWYTLRFYLFSVYRTHLSELLNETITSKSASAGASF